MEWNELSFSVHFLIPTHVLSDSLELPCTTNVHFLEISLSQFYVSYVNLFRSLGFWSFEFISNFEFRASDLVAATPRCDLCASDDPEHIEGQWAVRRSVLT
jgi:hypothetical protein